MVPWEPRAGIPALTRVWAHRPGAELGRSLPPSNPQRNSACSALCSALAAWPPAVGPPPSPSSTFPAVRLPFVCKSRPTLTPPFLGVVCSLARSLGRRLVSLPVCCPVVEWGSSGGPGRLCCRALPSRGGHRGGQGRGAVVVSGGAEGSGRLSADRWRAGPEPEERLRPPAPIKGRERHPCRALRPSAPNFFPDCYCPEADRPPASSCLL